MTRYVHARPGEEPGPEGSSSIVDVRLVIRRYISKNYSRSANQGHVGIQGWGCSNTAGVRCQRNMLGTHLDMTLQQTSTTS